MSSPMVFPAPDLRTAPPRSPNTMVGPYILLARILDKCRAVLAGTHGDYTYNCPLDRSFFDFLGLDADAFQEAVATGKTDDEMLAWVDVHRRSRTDDEIRTWTYDRRWAAPQEPAQKAYFERLRSEVAPENPYLQTWFQLLDYEEGQFVTKIAGC